MSKKLLNVTIGLAVTAAGIFLGPQVFFTGLAMTAKALLAKKPGVNKANLDRLNATLDANAARKIVFGTTAMATDVRYQAYTGASQDVLKQIICLASHQAQSVDEIWFENEKAWTVGGGAQGRFVGYLTVNVRLVGTSVNGIAIDAVWTASSRLTGCAYVEIEYKLTGTSSKATSPFSSGIPSRVTVRGSGALVYDPRLDSTVTGGSGAQRAADQTTWAWGASASRNPALQLLWYLLGWRIQDPAALTWRLAVGRGIPAARLDLPSFIAAANVCDESVALAAGGTQSRYRADGVYSEGDEPSTVLGILLGSMNAVLRDAGGKLALVCLKNDLGAPVAAFTEADIHGGDSWEQTPGFQAIPNIVRGRYTDASDNALYQMSDYPEVAIASLDGIDRIETVDYVAVQSSAQAQRLAKQYLQRRQYQGRFSATFGFRAWQVSLGDVISLSHTPLGWLNKLFRVQSQTLGQDGNVQMTMVEENAAIYAWSAEDSAAVTAAAPTVYNPLNDPLVAGIGAASNTIYKQATDPVGSFTIIDGDIWVDTSVTPILWKGRVSGAWQIGGNYVTQGTDIGVANGATKNTIYRQSSAPGSPIDGDFWVDTSVTPNVVKVRVSGAWQQSATNAVQGSDVGVDNGATKGRSAIVNGDAESGSTAPWTNEPQNTVGGGGSLSNTSTTPISGTRSFLITKAATGDASGFSLPAIQVRATKYLVRLAVVGNSATGSGLYIVAREKNAAPTGDYVLYAQETGEVLVLNNAAVPSTATETLYPYVPTAGTKFFSINVANYVNGPTQMRFEIDVIPITDLSTEITGKLPATTNLPNVSVLNLGYKVSVAPTYTAAAGTPATATISMAAFSVYTGSTTIAYNAMSVNVTGTNNTTITYFLYVDDAANAGGAQTLVATTTGTTVYQADGRVLLGSIDVFFPASGSGSGGGSGGSGGICVAADAWVETSNRGFVRARDVERGDVLRVLSEDREATGWEACTGNSIGTAPVWRIVSASGIAVTVSESTPIVLRDGRIVTVAELGAEADGEALPVLDRDGFRWEDCRAEPAGAAQVAKILCNQRTYAAGDAPGRSILTHNPKP